LKETRAAGQHLGIALHYVPVKLSSEFQTALDAISRERDDALLVFPDAFTMAHRSRIAEFAGNARLPSIFGWREYVEAGGLMAYGPYQGDSYRRVAVYVDKILKGAKPADLPVEQPTRFELVINVKTAKRIGLTVPPNVLARADRVIR
jgi:putative ABC transport system substrate-binding protein